MYDLELGQDLATLQNRSSRSTASSSDMINSRKNHNILDQFLGFSMAPGIGKLLPQNMVFPAVHF